MERVITIRPVADLLPVDIDIGMAHRPVEQDRRPLACLELRNLELGAVPAHTDEGKTAGTSGMLHRFLLSVLRNRHLLFIVLGTERAVDGPVVRDSHRLPLTVVESRLYKLIVILAGELPVFLQQELITDLRRHCRHTPEQPY